MSASASKVKLALVSFAALFMATATGYAADMVESYTPPRHVVAIHHYHHAPVRVTRVRATALDCGPVIYDYRTDPSYTEVKTVCSQPWTKTSTNDY